MHGQKRAEYKNRLANNEIAMKLSQKASQWNNLTGELLKRRRKEAMLDVDHGDKTNMGNSLQVTAKLLSVNPDPNYLWNYRREILNIQLSTEMDSTHEEEWLKQEQIVTQAALEANPKAYGAWFHRKWCIRRFLQKVLAESETPLASSSCQTVLDRELQLCAEFLTLDERNFHCWNYRRFIVACRMDLIILLEDDSANNKNKSEAFHLYMNGAWTFTQYLSDNNKSTTSVPTVGAQITTSICIEISDGKTSISQLLSKDVHKKIYGLIQSEYQFTYDKIAQNFSNGSAFHYRSKLLPFMLSFRSELNETQNFQFQLELVREELDIIRNAIFTEPDDQTCWWYLRFIVDWSNPVKQKRNGEHCEKDFDNFVEEYKDILYQEWLTITELVEAEEGRCKWGLLALHMIAMIFLDGDDGMKDTHFQGEDWLEYAQAYVSQLKMLDPDRSIRYDSLLKP